MPSSVGGVPRGSRGGEDAGGQSCLLGCEGRDERQPDSSHSHPQGKEPFSLFLSPPTSGLWDGSWGWPVGRLPGSCPPLPILAARDLPIEDQISLLKGATFELCQLRFNTVFNAETGTWECGRLSYCLEDPAGARESLPALAEGGKHCSCGRKGATPGYAGSGRAGQEDGMVENKILVRDDRILVRLLRSCPSILLPSTGGFQQLLLEPMLKFHYMLKKLQLHEEEYVLMQAISLFSPGEGLP